MQNRTKLLIKLIIFLIIIFILLFIGILLILLIRHFYIFDEQNISITFLFISIPLVYYVLFVDNDRQIAVNEATDDKIFDVIQQIEIDESQNPKIAEMITEKRMTIKERRKKAEKEKESDEREPESGMFVLIYQIGKEYFISLINNIFVPIYYKFRVFINYIKYSYKYFKRLIQSFTAPRDKI